MSEEAKDRLRKIRGQAFYDNLSKSLIFDSKQYAYDNINIDHRTLDDCLYNGNSYLNRFLFTLEPLLEFSFESLISIEELKVLIREQRYNFKIKQPASKTSKINLILIDILIVFLNSLEVWKVIEARYEIMLTEKEKDCIEDKSHWWKILI